MIDKILTWIYNLFKKEDKGKYYPFHDKDKIKLNVKKDKKDKRDRKLPARAIVGKLPKYIDLRKYYGPIKNQGQIGSCTAYAFCAAVEAQRNKEIVDYNSKEAKFDLSELFLYYNSRAIQGWENKDSGAYLRDVCKTLMKDGVAIEDVWEYNVTKYKNKPNHQAYLLAKFVRIKYYLRIFNKTEMKKLLSKGIPIIFSIKLYSNFFTHRSGVYSKNQGTYRGGHAMTIVGYDTTRNTFLIRNSWGPYWAEQGYCWYDCDLLLSNLIDAWAVDTNGELLNRK